MRVVVSTWYATWLADEGTVLHAETAPAEPEALAERALLRRTGALTPEEAALIARRGDEEWATRDRRLAEHGLRLQMDLVIPAAPSPPAGEPALRREALLRAAEQALDRAWDPSVHVQEAVRAIADLDRVRNLVGERLASWVGRDSPDLDVTDHAAAVRAALGTAEDAPLGPADPALGAARKRLARLYEELGEVHGELTSSVRAAAPRSTPNLSDLLGPELAARMVAAAGGLDRLARFPASTLQVLGAERAFFEHLRGRAPPPRHGLLFLHPSIQSAPRRERGKLARALAGKAAIAARLDQGGATVNDSLRRAYEARQSALKARRGATRKERPTRRLR